MKTIHKISSLKISMRVLRLLACLSVLSALAGPAYGQVGYTTNLVNNMSVKKFVLQEWIAGGGSIINPYGNFQDISNDTFLSNYFPTIDLKVYDDIGAIRTAVYAAIINQAVNVLGYSDFTSADILDPTFQAIATQSSDGLLSAADKTKLDGLAAAVARSFNNAPGRSITTNTGAAGFQISSTRDAQVAYSPTMITTASISGNASDVIALEICSTNSATAGNWIEIARVTNAQALTLAITLQSVQTTAGVLAGIVPAGYYAKIRAVTSGTVSNSVSSGQEVLL